MRQALALGRVPRAVGRRIGGGSGRGMATAAAALASRDRFAARHLGPRDSDLGEMLATVGVSSLNELTAKTVPPKILLQNELNLGPYTPGLSESDALSELRRLIEPNQVMRSMMGMGYHDCKTPTVILRNVLENPGWYTQYTPYQPEVAQGRLESLMNFQTMVADLTGMEMCNSSLLDEVRPHAGRGRIVGGGQARAGGWVGR
jgi:glycine dehydrogenase